MLLKYYDNMINYSQELIEHLEGYILSKSTKTLQILKTKYTIDFLFYIFVIVFRLILVYMRI